MKAKWLWIGRVLIIGTLLSRPAMAQDSGQKSDVPRAEAVLGYSYTSLDTSLDRLNANGFLTSGNLNFTKNFGFTGDLGGQWRPVDLTSGMSHSYEYLFGPTLSLRSGRATVFTHALYGGMKITGGADSGTGFAMGYGAGLDLNAGDHFAARVVQFDYIPWRVNGGDWRNHYRLGLGVVIK